MHRIQKIIATELISLKVIYIDHVQCEVLIERLGVLEILGTAGQLKILRFKFVRLLKVAL